MKGVEEVTGLKVSDKALEVADIDVLPLAVMLVDTSYQRELRERVVKEMLAEGYDMNAASTLIISERPPLRGMKDPRYYIVDGQHRRAVAMRSGETEHLVKIVRYRGSEAKLRQEEAKLRGKLGYRKADTPIERFKHKLAAGDDEALAIDSMVESFGGIIAVSQSSKGVQAISTLERIYRTNHGQHGKPLLSPVLDTITQGFGTFDGRAGESAMLDGIAWLLRKSGSKLDQAHLIRRLKAMPPEAVHARGTAMQATMGGALWKNYYRAIVEAYNNRLPEAKRLSVVEF